MPKLRPKNFSFTKHSGLWIFQRTGLGQLFLSLQTWGQKFFRNFFIYIALWTLNFSERGVWAPNFLSHVKFEVKIFLEFLHLTNTVDSEFVREASRPTFFGHAKFKVKIFMEFFHLPSTLDWIFQRGVQASIFFGHTKFGTKFFVEFFLLLSTLDWIFQRGCTSQLFLVMPDLRSKILMDFFHLPSTVDPEFFQIEGLGTNFFGSCEILSQNIFQNFFIS